MLSSRARTTAVAAAATAALTLTACGGDSESDATSSAAGAAKSVSSEDSTALEGIDVTAGTEDKAPSVKVAKAPVAAKETATKVIKEGEGEALAEGSLAKVDMALFNGKDGKALQQGETYSADPAVLPMTVPEQFPGLVKAVQGQKVGTSGVAIIPPKDVFGEQGNPQLGIDGKDSLVLVFDVRGAVPTEAKGEEVAPKEGLPTVEVPADKPATFTMPKSKPSTKLVAQPLIKGEGKEVKKGDTVYVSYTGATYRDGKVFDSSKKEGAGQPFPFQVGGGQVIKGWDEGIEGQTVGSRVLLTIPPSKGYGKQGQPDAGIKGTDTLVFVVDILDAP